MGFLGWAVGFWMGMKGKGIEAEDISYHVRRTTCHVPRYYREMPNRCGWARTPLEIEYHDHEWGVPVHNDRLLFEFLVLEGAQAGLSWSTILKKRAAYRKAFADFDAAKVARFNEKKFDGLMANAGIVRNRLKIHAAIENAKS